MNNSVTVAADDFFSLLDEVCYQERKWLGENCGLREQDAAEAVTLMNSKEGDVGASLLAAALRLRTQALGTTLEEEVKDYLR